MTIIGSLTFIKMYSEKKKKKNEILIKESSLRILNDLGFDTRKKI